MNEGSDSYIAICNGLKPYFIDNSQLNCILQLIGAVYNDNGVIDQYDNVGSATQRSPESNTFYSKPHKCGIIFEAKPGCGKSSILRTIRNVLGSQCCIYIDCSGSITERR